MKYYVTKINDNGNIAVDDTILVKDVQSAAGSRILEGFKPLFSAEAVTRLENKGYTISGKTNVGEFGLDLAGEFSYYAEKSADIKGAAAELVANGEVKAALGVDMNGSTRRSAALSGVDFLKPTYGTVSRYGIISCAASGEQLGVYAKNAEGIKEIMDVIAGHDDKDGTSLRNESYDYTINSDVSGKKVCIIKELMEKDLSKYESLSLIYKKNNVKILSFDMEEYPKNLKILSSPPLVIYCRGKFINLNERFCISVVGTRKITDYGINCTKNITSDIARRGAVIVSGMAAGVDSYAHNAALDEGMPTVAVIGTGVNMVYPKSNSALMKRIMENGMVISEYQFNSEPKPWHFPERNRIIAGLSKGTLVVEGEEQSGSLITANYAIEFNRDVFAVPGNIDSLMSKGTNNLIKKGAYAAVSAEDVLGQYRDVYGHLLKPILRTPADVSDYEKEYEKQETAKEIISLDGLSDKEKIYTCLGADAMHIDVICEMTNLSAQVVNSSLLMLELEGKIMSYAGNMYSRKDI